MRTLAELQDLCAEYVEVAFPDIHQIDAMTEQQRQRGADRMHTLAMHIADLVIEAGLHRGEALR